MPPRRKPPTASTPLDATAAARRAMVEAVVADAISRRAAGEDLPDSAILQANPSLSPDLDEELLAVQAMHRIFLAARKAGPVTESAEPSEPAGEKPSSDTKVLTSAEGSGHVGSVTIQGYSILHEISSGGQGTVFRATQDATARAVAIKVIPGGVLTGSRHRARFDREAAILAKLDHPNIVGILDRGRTDDGSLFLVMPFIDGRTLDDHLERLGKDQNSNLKELLRVFVQIAQAVAEAHQQGIIHRDLKPANIRIDRGGRPHILDFGLARVQTDSADHLRSITMTGQIIGSLPWTSPEQISHQTGEVDARTDVYALGVILYQCVADTFPYSVLGSVREVFDNIAHAIPVPPSRTEAGAHRGADSRLDAIVLRALAKSPADRYQTAKELADDLERYLAGQPLAVTTKAVARPRRPLTKLVLLLACAVLILGSAAIVAWSRPSYQVVQLEEITNSVGMRMLRIPRGEFFMGSPESEPGRDVSETQKLVRIERDFLISATEVTQKQYPCSDGRTPGRDIGKGRRPARQLCQLARRERILSAAERTR